MTVDELSYLISSYLIVADGEINDKELQVLNGRHNPSATLTDEQAKIFADDETKISIDRLLLQMQNVTENNVRTLLKGLFAVAYADGFYDQREKNFINSIAAKLNMSQSLLVLIENEVQSRIQDETWETSEKEFSWTDSLKAAFKALIYELKEDKDDGEEYELLSGTRFVKKVESIAKSSQEDLSLAEDYMIRYNSLLSNYFSELQKNVDEIEKAKRKDEEVTEFIKVVEQLSDSIKQNLIDSLAGNLEVLNKKKRTINYFTIAFMGRTKAGKSTLHKVVTHEEEDDIGVGRLRTTRYNRSWYWENIRIVDTPGIGAPGGKSDTETAKTIIDEADLICYVVTNDSIQETEFDFLKQLKERSKPLFIILNIKENLEHPIRLKRFLKEPLKWKTDQGDKNIQGHFDRIRECIGDNYDFNFIEIIPLQLLAAKLYFSDSEFSIENKQALMEGSNIKEFIYKIKQSVYRTGSLKKTQNIVDGCGYQISQIRETLSGKHDEISAYSQALEKKKNELKGFIGKERVKVANEIRGHIINAHKELRNNARGFADKYYDRKSDLEKLWKEDEDNKRVYKTLDLNIQTSVREFVKNVQSRVEECFSDLAFQINQKDINSSLSGEGITDWKFGARIVTSLLTCAASIWGGATLFALTNFWNPVGWGIAVGVAVATLGALLVGMFTSKDTKIKKAKDKLSETLSKELDSNENKMLENILRDLNKNIDNVESKLTNSFSILLDNTSYILCALKAIIAESEKYEKIFGSIFAYRLLQQLGKQNRSSIKDVGIDLIMQQISAKRIYEKSMMTVQCPYAVDADENARANELTQLQITFI